MYQQFINVSGKEWHSLFYTKVGAWLWLEDEALKNAQAVFFQCDNRKCQRPRGQAVLGESWRQVWAPLPMFAAKRNVTD